jgi:hypothetical protein
MDFSNLLQGGGGNAAVPGVVQAGGNVDLNQGFNAPLTVSDKPIGNTFQGFGASPQSPVTPAPTSYASTPAPSQPSNSGGGSSAANGFGYVRPAPVADPGPVNTQPIFDQAKADADAKAAADTARTQALQLQQQQGIKDQWAPILQNLDRQVGLLPQQRTDLEGRVNDLITSQKAGVQGGMNAADSKINAASTAENVNTTNGLRDLDQNGYNLLQANNQHLSAMGSDSSAVPFSDEVVARGINQDRTSFLNNRNAVQAELQQKHVDVQNMANDQNNQIDQWKSSKLYDLTQWFQDAQSKLNDMKANASSSQQGDVNKLNFQLGADLQSRLRQLDDSVSTFKNGISSWQTEHQGDLSNGLKLIQQTAAYQMAPPNYGGGGAARPAPYTGQVLNTANGHEGVVFNPNTGTYTAQPIGQPGIPVATANPNELNLGSGTNPNSLQTLSFGEQPGLRSMSLT